MRELDIVVVGYNVRDFIKPCLESIFSCGDKVSFKCYYVDDGSKDATADLVENSFPQVEVIRNKENMGWGAACNRGMEKGDSDFILLVNSDVTINKDALDAPVEYFRKNPDVGAIGGRIYLPDGRLQKECMCRAFPTLLSEFISLTVLDRVFKTNRFFGQYKMLYLDYDKEVEVDQPSGTYLAIRRKAIDDIGFLDERYRFYYDDADWSYRLKKRGWRQMFIPDGSVIHYGTPHGGKTISQMGYEVITRRVTNKLYFFRKNYGRLGYYLLRPIVFIEVLAKLFVFLVYYVTKQGKEKSMALRNIKAFSKAIEICLRPLPDYYRMQENE